MRSLFLLLISCLFLTCQEAQQHPTGEVQEKQKKVKTNTKPTPTIRIYDLKADGSKGFSNVPVSQKSGDPLRDAIRHFFEFSNWKGDYRAVRLNRIGMINRQALFDFGGTVHFENKEDQQIFRAALDSTLIYHYKNKNFHVQLNGSPW